MGTGMPAKVTLGAGSAPHLRNVSQAGPPPAPAPPPSRASPAAPTTPALALPLSLAVPLPLPIRTLPTALGPPPAWLPRQVCAARVGEATVQVPHVPLRPPHIQAQQWVGGQVRHSPDCTPLTATLASDPRPPSPRCTRRIRAAGTRRCVSPGTPSPPGPGTSAAPAQCRGRSSTRGCRGAAGEGSGVAVMVPALLQQLTPPRLSQAVWLTRQASALSMTRQGWGRSRETASTAPCSSEGKPSLSVSRCCTAGRTARGLVGRWGESRMGRQTGAFPHSASPHR